MRRVVTALLAVATGSLVVFLNGCATGSPTVATTPHLKTSTVPIAHIGLNGWYHAQIDPRVAVQLPAGITIRTAVQSLGQAQAVLTQWKGPVLLLVETIDPVLVGTLASLRAPNLVGIELGNELELQNVTTAEFGQWISQSVQILTAAAWPYAILSGGIYAITSHTIAFLQGAGAAGWPQNVTIGVHFYEDASDDLLGQLQALNHPIAITETGMPSRTPAEDQTQLTFLRSMKARAQQIGVSWWLVYQCCSAASASNLDNFGVCRTDGTCKPSLSVLK